MSSADRIERWLTTKRARGIVLCLAGVLALRGLYRLLMAVHHLSGSAGFDFAYVWLAGRMWVEGNDPYDSDYLEQGSALIPSGHVPELWAYPPSWWPISSAFGLTPLQTANVVWNLMGVGLCLLSSFFVVSAFRWAYSGRSLDHPVLSFVMSAGLAVPLLHFFGASEFEANTLTLGVGQTSLIVYFGIAALLYGIARESRLICALGLTIILLKPQIGLAFAVLFLAYNRWSFQALALAFGLSALMALPALFIDPLAPLEMLQNMARYDGVVSATLPQATTGLRLVFWQAFGIDIGGLISGLVAAIVALVTALILRRRHASEDERQALWLCTTVAAATTVALAPLHYYDFVIVACLVPAVLIARLAFAVAGLIGTALILRADALGKLTGFYDPEVAVFEGSLLSTAGGTLLLVALWGTAREFTSSPPRPASALSV